MLVNLSWFLYDRNDAAKFRTSRRELWGTFPSVVPISKKASDPALQAENGPLSSRMGTFQRRRSIKVLSGYGCELWYVPTELGLPGPEKWEYCRRCLKEQLNSGPKKDHMGKIGSWEPKMLALIQCGFEKQTAQYMEPKNTPEINENTI